LQRLDLVELCLPSALAAVLDKLRVGRDPRALAINPDFAIRVRPLDRRDGRTAPGQLLLYPLPQVLQEMKAIGNLPGRWCAPPGAPRIYPAAIATDELNFRAFREPARGIVSTPSG
jgi:hypothetical protein